MAYTKHGHYIYGSGTGGIRPAIIARCGGPKLCKDCARDVANWRDHNKSPNGLSIEKLVDIIEEELESLWYKLCIEHRNAVNGEWSIAIESTLARMAKLTRVVGPTPWDRVVYDLLYSGVYDAFHESLGVSVPSRELVISTDTLVTVRAKYHGLIIRMKSEKEWLEDE